MKRLITTLVITLVFCSASYAQYLYEDSLYEDTALVAFDLPIPEVVFNDRAATFQASLYPDFYKTNSLRSDLRWVRQHDSALIDFWHTLGDSTLWLLSQLSGLDWVEDQFDIYALRYYPSFGSSDPLAIPIGGIRKGVLAVAAPEGSVQQLNLIYQLSHRMLAQAEKSDDAYYRAMATHPLLQPTPYRRDNIALLLALVTAQQVIGLDSTFDAYQSAFWKEHTPGRTIFEQYLLSDWILTADHPLAQWIIDEPYNSRLVSVTRTPRRTRSAISNRPRAYVEGLPLKGELGFSVRLGDNNRLTVDKIDPARLAYACGLREGDVLRSVDSRRLRTHKQMIEYVLEGLDKGGATLAVLRESEDLTVLIQPLDLFLEEDDLFYYEGIEDDTMYFEMIPVDSVLDTITLPELVPEP
jgi:hypothetical protein